MANLFIALLCIFLSLWFVPLLLVLIFRGKSIIILHFVVPAMSVTYLIYYFLLR